MILQAEFSIIQFLNGLHLKWLPTVRLGNVAVFENRQPGTEAKFMNKSSLFILLPGFIRRPAILQPLVSSRFSSLLEF